MLTLTKEWRSAIYFSQMTIFVAVFYCGFPQTFAQQVNIKGNVTDSVNQIHLFNSRVLILNDVDSMLIKFTRTQPDGGFILQRIKPGKYIILITFPGYADRTESLIIDSVNTLYDLGTISMITKARLLAEVVIHNRNPIKVRGDTTEFRAEGFVIQPNAKVEDLLKQLPGITVDKNGGITAQGVSVNKVLVDGEEFFGEDPTLVTRNIRGDMVDKIQLYDKKTDRAVFLGIEDGKKIKTLNVVLKEDSKNGFFGKVNAGLADKGYYEGQTMYNTFTDRRKIAFYGNIGNTGKTGPGFSDGNRFGIVPTSITTVNGVTGFFDELEGTGKYSGGGIPLAQTSGIHYDSKWNKNKQSINANYRIGSISSKGTDYTWSQEILQNDITTNLNNADFENKTFRQKLDLTYQVQFDPSLSLKVISDGTFKKVSHQNITDALRRREDVYPLTKQLNIQQKQTDMSIVNNALYLAKQFKKIRRTIVLDITQSFSDARAEGFQKVNNEFYSLGELDSAIYLDQKSDIDSKNLNLNVGLAYSEPIGKHATVLANYTIIYNTSDLKRQTFDAFEPGKYASVNRNLTNIMDFQETGHQAGLIINFRKSRSILNGGVRIYSADYFQNNKVSNVIYQRNYLNIVPALKYQYNFSKEKSFKVNYSGTTIQPRINQLQPILMNEDPLNVFNGNPDLKPAFQNQVSSTFNSFKVLSNLSLYINTTYSLVSNPIANSYFTQSSGKTLITPINILGYNSKDFTLSSEISRKFKKGYQLTINVNGVFNKLFEIINNEVNQKNYQSYTAGFSATKDQLEKYSITFMLNSLYSKSIQSIRTLKSDFWQITSGTNFAIYLPGHVELNGSFVYRYIPHNQLANTINPTVINLGVNKKFFKGENLRTSINVDNLLNQNSGFTFRPNYENRYTTIMRYFIASVSWDFSKMKAKR